MERKHLFRAAALAVLLAAAVALEVTKITVPTQDSAAKLAASRRAQACYEAIRQRKAELGIEIDAADINRTGMIGLEYSFITTTIGNLEAKRTAINPNMAAVVVDMLHEVGLEKGDKVAVNCSGSFPALNIAVMCAIEELELDPFLISSFGASTHGANDPRMTYLDMEHTLVEAGLLSHSSDFFSIGGMEDLGKEMDPGLRQTITERILSYGYRQFYDEDLLHNVAERYALYRSQGDVKCFLNVGGNDVSFGDSSVIVHTDGGILTQLSEKDNSTGLVQLFLKDGTPVIHLLNMKSIASDYGLPIDPVPLPQPGEGGVYYETSYRRGLAVSGLGAACILLWLGREQGASGREEKQRKSKKGQN